MSRVPSRSARRAPARHVAPSPAVAGFRPAQAALAIAAAFSLQPALLQAQPSGGQAIHGHASFSVNGNNLVVTTQNGAGTSHSAINWQSFSIPGGSTTHFAQPSANSTSINRVVGPDPSAIYGTLSSNGKLVLVNPAGITVGAGAVVDTAGFTASTLKMSEADAIAGRLLFQGEGSGVLQVDGRVIARSGDVVLIGSKVQTGAAALVESEGSTVLAAGQKVEITGRGLEGIRMEVQAGNEAVNLGTLKGDAVGIFAGTLRHSGLVQAQGVSTEGGKVVLKAGGGDAIVDGGVRALRSDGVGGHIDVLGQRVALLAGAKLDASGPNGGGQVRVGGDFQGKNPDVPNALRTYVDAAASINADATVRGNGGRVIVWSDEVTRMHGHISARGGAEGGNGGFTEVSGKQFLDFNGRVDLRAPQGAAGTLLLDPEDITIVSSTDVNENIMSSGTPPDYQYTSTGGPSKLRDATLVSQLELGNVVVTTAAASGTGGQITVNGDANVTWTNASELTLLADKGITVNGTLSGTSAASAVTLTAQGGNIDVNAGANISAGGVTLQATGADTDVNINSASINATSQSLAIKATRDVNIGRNVATSTSTYLAAAQQVSIEAGRSVRTSLAVGGGETFGSYVTIQGNGTTGERGVKINALSGDVDFGVSTNLYAGAAPVVVSASGSIAGQVTVNTQGSATPDPLAGAVTFDAGGDIGFSYISSGSYAGLHGGNVTLTAGGNIAGGTIRSVGGYAYSAEGGHGGDVTVTSTGGFIDIGDISTRGGASYETVPSGTPAPPPIPAGNGGHGGAVVLSGKTGVYVSAIEANGGESYGTNVPPASGGDAGSVSVTAETGDVYLEYVNVNGGSGSTAKDGGSATIKALAGNVYLSRLESVGGVAYGTGTSGKGGTVKVQAAGNIELTPESGSFAIYADGGAGDRGAGGQGGSIELKMGGDLIVDPSVVEMLVVSPSSSASGVSATGGQGGNTEADGATAGAGGNGGSVVVHRTGGGSLVLDATVILAAGGGEGGNASGVGGSGGAGGNGGTISLFADGASVVLRSPALDATGGAGGSGSASYGTSGALGKLTAMGTSVEVESDLDLNAVWENSSNVHIRNASVVGGMGTFRNMGGSSHVNLYDTASLAPLGGVENKGRITSFGVNAVKVTQNLGLLEVAAGGRLSTPLFANEGTVKVDGILEAGPPPSLLIDCVSACVLAAATAPGGTFTNLAGGVITGNGTLVVGGGLGIVDNYGTIAPGGEGTVGTLTLDGSLAMQSGSTVATDLLGASSFDVLKVSGTTTTGGSYAINYLPGASFAAGTTFRVLESGALDATTLPSVSVPELSAASSGNDLLMVAGKDFPSAPPPAAPQEQQAAQQMNNQVVTFAELFIEESEKQDEEKRIGRDDIVVTDTSCKPS